MPVIFGGHFMDFTLKSNVKIIAALLLIAAITQAVYTGLYVAEVDVPRQLLWGFEGFLFVILAAFAGSALAQARRFYIVWSAIAMSAVLNVVQVGVGLTMFGPFREVAVANEALEPLAGSVVAFSFMVYNAAKVLLALAAIAAGLAKMAAPNGGGGKALGTLTAVIGAIAFITNTLSMAMGRGFSGDLPLAGGTGVLATILLALCLSATANED